MMNDRTRATLSRAGRVAAGSLIAVSALAASATTTIAAGGGSIWTTSETCASPAAQDANLYSRGETVYLRGRKFRAGAGFSWTIAGLAGGASQDPSTVVASGVGTTTGSGTFCIAAYVVAGDDWGEYKATVFQTGTSKVDNYDVNAGSGAIAATGGATGGTTGGSGGSTSGATGGTTGGSGGSTSGATGGSGGTGGATGGTGGTGGATGGTTGGSGGSTSGTSTDPGSTGGSGTTGSSGTTTTDPGTSNFGTSTPNTGTGGSGTTDPGSGTTTTDPATGGAASTQTVVDQPTQEVLGITAAGAPRSTIAMPPTDTLGESTGTTSPAFLIAGLAAVTGLAVLLTPTRRRNADRQA
ncbi:MAG: hypothetical protein HY264_00070 [Chloroflexi bacterium]|nr:hypothetical protein [Chloroflexota bacterium]